MIGLRTIGQLIPIFETIVNVVHQKLLKAKFALNIEIDKPQDACWHLLAP